MTPVLLPLGNGRDDTARINRACHSLDAVVLGAGTFILSGTITVTRSISISAATAGATTLSWAALGSGVCGMTVSASNVNVTGVTFSGPQSGQYVANEDLVRIIGGSAASPRTGINFQACTFQNCGSIGLYGKYVSGIVVASCTFAGCGYAGAMFLSCSSGDFSRNTIGTIGPGTGNPANGYGVSLTHDSTGWPGTRTAQPMCSTWTIQSNTITGVPWEGIDAHGGSNITVTHNTVTDCMIGIAVASSSGDAANYAGANNVIANNTIDGGTRANTGAGIIIDGGSVEPQTNTKVIGNIITRHGKVSTHYSGAILASNCDGCTIDGNTITRWGTSVVYMSGIQNVTVINNSIGTLESAQDTHGYVIYSDATSGTLTTDKNLVLSTATVAPKRGVQAAQLATQPTFGFDDLYAATEAAYVLYDANWIPS